MLYREISAISVWLALAHQRAEKSSVVLLVEIIHFVQQLIFFNRLKRYYNGLGR